MGCSIEDAKLSSAKGFSELLIFSLILTITFRYLTFTRRNPFIGQHTRLVCKDVHDGLRK
jgi:hypothetical protein